MPKTAHTSKPARAEEAFRAILSTMGAMRHVMDPFFAQFGLSGAQWGFLWTLHNAQQAGESVRLTDLSNKMIIRPPSATVLVDRLVRLGLVERIRQGRDQRSTHILLTPQGRLLVAKVKDAHTAQMQRVFSGLPSADIDHLRRIMDSLRRHLDSLNGVHEETTPRAHAALLEKREQA